ncbi:MAG: FCD domain-containing protein, partial [Halocynthiibacter sp.]
QLNSLRRTVVWGRLRQRSEYPPGDHHSFREHQEILEAVSDRDGEGARDAMYRHIRSVNQMLYPN